MVNDIKHSDQDLRDICICIYDNIYDDYDIFAWNVRIMSCVVACSSAEPFLCKYVLMIYFGSFCGLLCVQHRYDVESRRYCQSGGGGRR